MHQIFLKVAEDSGVDSVELSGKSYNISKAVTADGMNEKKQAGAPI